MRSKKQLFSLLLSLLLIALFAVAWLQRQQLFDWVRLQGYQPSNEVAQLATDTTMRPETRRVFYVYHPQLEDKSSFSNHCPNQGEKTIVLGCYINPTGIYLFQVTDERLKGVEQVTAAHETLHAEYDRLSTADKKHVDDLINQAYTDVSDQRIRDTIEAYRKAGDDVTNELHSILGTEVRNLPPELETYYARYFTDRGKIVSYSEQYEKTFADRKALADSYLKQLNNIEAQLKTMRADIDAMEADLRSQYQSLQQERQTTRDAATYNAKVDSYNNQVNAYKAKIDAYNQLVGEHNTLLQKYNEVALEENELIKAIDSRSTTVQSQ